MSSSTFAVDTARSIGQTIAAGRSILIQHGLVRDGALQAGLLFPGPPPANFPGTQGHAIPVQVPIASWTNPVAYSSTSAFPAPPAPGLATKKFGSLFQKALVASIVTAAIAAPIVTVDRQMRTRPAVPERGPPGVRDALRFTSLGATALVSSIAAAAVLRHGLCPSTALLTTLARLSRIQPCLPALRSLQRLPRLLSRSL